MAVFTKGNVISPMLRDHTLESEVNHLRENDIVLLGYKTSSPRSSCTLSLRDFLVNNKLAAQGVQGLQGEQGPGVQGFTGSQGIIGEPARAQGAQGSTGSTGEDASLREDQLSVLIDHCRKLSIPIGSIMWYPKSILVDECWKLCDGSYISRGAYPDYAEQIGDTWGEHIDRSYKLPNLLNGLTFLGTSGGGVATIKENQSRDGNLYTTIDWSSVGVPKHSHQILFTRNPNLNILASENPDAFRRARVSSAEGSEITLCNTPNEASDAEYEGGESEVFTQDCGCESQNYLLTQLKLVPYIKVRNNQNADMLISEIAKLILPYYE